KRERIRLQLPSRCRAEIVQLRLECRQYQKELSCSGQLHFYLSGTNFEAWTDFKNTFPCNGCGNSRRGSSFEPTASRTILMSSAFNESSRLVAPNRVTDVVSG